MNKIRHLESERNKSVTSLLPFFNGTNYSTSITRLRSTTKSQGHQHGGEG